MTEVAACAFRLAGRIDNCKINRKIFVFRFVGREINSMGMR
jgi:hypothetical protein